MSLKTATITYNFGSEHKKLSSKKGNKIYVSKKKKVAHRLCVSATR